MSLSDLAPLLDLSPNINHVGERRRDEATWFGLGIGGLLILGAIALGGSFLAYLDLPAALIVLGGTAAVTTVSFPLHDITALPFVLRTALFRSIAPARTHALYLMQLADQAKRVTVLSLEDEIPAMRHDHFLMKAVALVVDETPPEEIERLLRAELHAMLGRHRASADILRRGGEVAPAMGLIGTLIGLVQMLSHLSDPSTVGPAMAVAVLATLYGAILANMVLLPLAAKLDRNNQSEAQIANLSIIAACSIAARENPRRLEMTLNGILPPASRIDIFD